MKSNKLKLMTVTALLTALNIVISRILIIPIPFTHGNINLCDAGIFIIAMLYGPWPGLFAGAVSGFLLDLISGYSQYMFFSLIVHGLEGLLVGFLFQYLHAEKSKMKQIGIMLVGTLIMVAGYFCSDSILYNVQTGLLGIPMNCIQGVVGLVVALLLTPQLRKIIKY